MGSSPPHVSFSSIPCFVVERSTGGLDAPIALFNRPRPSFLRRPAKGNAYPESQDAFHRQESEDVEIAPHFARTGAIHDAADPTLRRACIATGGTGASVPATPCLASDEVSAERRVGQPWPGVVPGSRTNGPQSP